MSFTVNLKHKEFGSVVIENVTEIHFCYPSALGKRIAFESDVEGMGCTYPVEDVIEFEAVEQMRGADDYDFTDPNDNPYILSGEELARAEAAARSRKPLG